jgi:hypothetical protein
MADFKSKDFALRAQKKLLGKMNKNLAMLLIDDVSANILDNFHRFAKANSSKKDAEKIVKNIIKITVKMGVLDKNEQFSDDDFKKIDVFKDQFKSLTLTLISFHEVAFSYERDFLIRLLNKCRDSLKAIVLKHLSAKSLVRIDSIFDFFTQQVVLDSFFSHEEEAVLFRTNVIDDISRLVENDSF